MSVHPGKHKVGELPARVKVLLALDHVRQANALLKGLNVRGGRIHGNSTVDDLITDYFGIPENINYPDIIDMDREYARRRAVNKRLREAVKETL